MFNEEFTLTYFQAILIIMIIIIMLYYIMNANINIAILQTRLDDYKDILYSNYGIKNNNKQ